MIKNIRSRSAAYGRKAVSAGALSGVALPLALLCAAPAWAEQAASEPAPAAEAAQPEGGAAAATADIVVYAQKRGAQSVQKVPVAITAFSEAKLAAVFAKNIESLSFTTPNVALDGLGYPGLANFSIRGLGSNSSIPSIDPAVGVFVDGIYLGTTTGVIFDFFDLESVEILRGPQGVLFGKNVSGGAILLRNKRPGREFAVNGKVSLESGLKKTVAASVEGPVSDTLAAKMVGYYSDSNGLIRNITNGGHDGDDRTRFLRGSVYYDGEGLNAYLAIEYGKQNGDGGTEQNVPATGGRKFTVASNETGFSASTWKTATLELNGDVDFGNGKVTSITGYRDTDTRQLTDADGTKATIFHLGTKTYAEQFSEELRYAGTFANIWDVTSGLYYFHQNLNYFEQRFLTAGTTAFGGQQETTSYGAFVNNDVHVTDTITLTAGVRYTSERKQAKIAPQILPLTATPSCNFVAETCVYNFSGKHQAKGWTPKLGVQWKPDNDTLFYASFSKGFRSGGYNLRHTVATTPRATGDEKLTSYEAGAKLQFLDRRLTTNIAIFRTQIDNILRDTLVPDPITNAILQLNQNAGNAHVQGIELETTARVLDNLALNFSVGYNKGKYDKIFLDISGDAVVNQHDYQLILPRLSKWSLSVGGNYDFDLGSSGLLSARADYSYRSTAPYNDSNTGILRAANMLNSSLTWKPEGGTFTVSVYGRNLLKSATEGSATPAGYGFIRLIKPGRIVGGEIKFSFH